MAETVLNLKENLHDKFVAYIDVMGFSNLVNGGNVKNLEAYFLKIIEVLKKIREDKGDLKSLLISDAIILISPSGHKGLRDIILATRRIQSALLWQNILLRGAISFGQVFYHQTHNIIVGKGFIRAYLLEQEAIYPRVLIDPSVVKIVGDDKAAFLKSLQSDSADNFDERLIYTKSEYSLIQDDCIFVDYANKTIMRQSINGNISKIYDTIKLNLYGDQRLYSKYVWLRDYFIERLKMVDTQIEIDRADVLLFQRRTSPSVMAQKRDVAEWLIKFERL